MSPALKEIWWKVAYDDGDEQNERESHLSHQKKKQQQPQAIPNKPLLPSKPPTAKKISAVLKQSAVKKKKKPIVVKKKKKKKKKPTGKTGMSGYRGVTLQNKKKFKAVLYDNINGTNFHRYLGTFETAKEAAEAYDCAIIKYQKPLHKLNFPTQQYEVTKKKKKKAEKKKKKNKTAETKKKKNNKKKKNTTITGGGGGGGRKSGAEVDEVKEMKETKIRTKGLMDIVAEEYFATMFQESEHPL